MFFSCCDFHGAHQQYATMTSHCRMYMREYDAWSVVCEIRVSADFAFRSVATVRPKMGISLTHVREIDQIALSIKIVLRLPMPK